MLKKLTESQQTEIIDKAIQVFAEKGYKGAGLSTIAKSAGVSVGVIYKYYKDKEELFRACVSKSIAYLDQVISLADQGSSDLPGMIQTLVEQVQLACREHPEYFRMYHQITISDDEKQAEQLAQIIEMPAAKAYKKAVRQAQKEGKLDEKLDPGAGAFFLDNLMMMLHFAYSGFYYGERMEIYCGKRLAANEKKLGDQMTRFILNGLGYKE